MIDADSDTVVERRFAVDGVVAAERLEWAAAERLIRALEVLGVLARAETTQLLELFDWQSASLMPHQSTDFNCLAWLQSLYSINDSLPKLTETAQLLLCRRIVMRQVAKKKKEIRCCYK
jgi:hypothetical protein